MSVWVGFDASATGFDGSGAESDAFPGVGVAGVMKPLRYRPAPEATASAASAAIAMVRVFVDFPRTLLAPVRGGLGTA